MLEYPSQNSKEGYVAGKLKFAVAGRCSHQGWEG